MKNSLIKKLYAEKTSTKQLRALVAPIIFSELEMDIINLSYELDVNHERINQSLQIIENVEEIKQYMYEREDNFHEVISQAITVFSRDELEDFYSNINRKSGYEKLFDYFDFLKTINNEYVKDIHFIRMLLEYKVKGYQLETINTDEY